MKRFYGLYLACLCLIGCGLACEKQQDVSFSEPFPKIEASYGELVAVTAIDQYPDWNQLWFEDEEGTIRILRVQLSQNKLLPQVKTIERTGQMAKEEVMEDEK